MDLSVIIVSYNSRFFLELCLSSLKEAAKNIKSEIIVVDNNSNDDSINMIKSLFPEVLLIENNINLGFSSANNLGVKKAKGKFICFLNPDTIVSENLFNKILKFKESNDKIGIIGCKMIDGQGKFLPESKRNLPTLSMVLNKFLGLKNNYHLNILNEDEIGQADVLCGAIMLMNKKEFEDVGGFDEKYFMFGEDIDLSYKMKNKGLKNYYLGNLSIIHYKGESTIKNMKYYRSFYGAMGIYYRKFIANNIISKFFSYFLIELIVFAHLFKFKSKSNFIDNTKDSYIVSNKDYFSLKSRGTKRIQSIESISNKIENCEIIFDSNYITFNDIISSIQTLSNNKNLIFKILSKGSNFIIGSNNSNEQGEVILFDSN